MSLEGKIALVTGASKGIGAAIAKTLAREGAQVVINYRSDTEHAQRLKEEIDTYGTATLAQADVADAEAVKQMVAAVRDRYGRLDILVNNAGVRGPVGALELVPLEELHKAMETNFWGAVHTTREALPLMKQNKYGRIVFISVGLADRPAAKIAAYAFTKGAVNSLANAVGVEGGPYGVTSNVIIPGPVDTDLGHSTSEVYAADEALRKGHFMIPEPVPPHAIGETVVALCNNPYLTAQKIYVDNGWQRQFIIPRTAKKA